MAYYVGGLLPGFSALNGYWFYVIAKGAVKALAPQLAGVLSGSSGSSTAAQSDKLAAVDSASENSVLGVTLDGGAESDSEEGSCASGYTSAADSPHGDSSSLSFDAEHTDSSSDDGGSDYDDCEDDDVDEVDESVPLLFAVLDTALTKVEANSVSRLPSIISQRLGVVKEKLANAFKVKSPMRLSPQTEARLLQAAGGNGGGGGGGAMGQRTRSWNSLLGAVDSALEFHESASELSLPPTLTQPLNQLRSDIRSRFEAERSLSPQSRRQRRLRRWNSLCAALDGAVDRHSSTSTTVDSGSDLSLRERVCGHCRFVTFR